MILGRRRAAERHSDRWLTPAQEHLLRACLLEDSRAVTEWECWRNLVDLEHVDAGSYRMIPLLFRSLTKHGVQDPVLRRYQGIYKKSWYKNQLLIASVERITQTLAERGISFLALKGVALILSYYEELALRPMQDIDILVRTQDVRAAVAALQELGLRPKPLDPERPDHLPSFDDEMLRGHNAHELVRSDGQMSVDLHWNVFLSSLGPRADEDFWSERVRSSSPTGRFELDIMNPTDLLFHVCVHGASWNPIPPFRWVADAATILRVAGARIDARRLLRLAHRFQKTRVLRESLSRLVALLGLTLPDGLTDLFGGSKLPLIERLHHRVESMGTPALGVFEPLWFYYLRHFSPEMERSGFLGAARSFPGYLVREWGLERRTDLPGRLVRKAVTRLQSEKG